MLYTSFIHLFIFFISDFYIYRAKDDRVIEVSRDCSKIGGPDAGFTQRATIDSDLNEFYVFSGLMREKNSNQDTVKNTFWVYNIQKNSWSKVYQNENTDHAYWAKMQNIEPCPRFAHQLVYNPKTKVCKINIDRVTIIYNFDLDTLSFRWKSGRGPQSQQKVE
jgi:hypothetical protein